MASGIVRSSRGQQHQVTLEEGRLPSSADQLLQPIAHFWSADGGAVVCTDAIDCPQPLRLVTGTPLYQSIEEADRYRDVG